MDALLLAVENGQLAVAVEHAVFCGGLSLKQCDLVSLRYTGGTERRSRILVK